MEAVHPFEEPEEEPTPAPALDVAPGGSVLDAVRKRREALAGERHYDLEVPGYRGCVVLRCGPIDGAKLAQVRERQMRAGSGGGAVLDFAFNADLVIDSCREVLARRHPDDPLETIDPDGGTVRIDAHLAELLGVQATRARDVLLALFSPAPAPEVAIERAQMELYQWSSGAEGEVEEELLGES
jgi:hypothetical protein